MAIEYYVIRALEPSENSQKAFELCKYNTNKLLVGKGNVFQTQEGNFISDDSGFKKHGNEDINRRIRIVKKHIELGEPKFAAYWLNRGNIECFKV